MKKRIVGFLLCLIMLLTLLPVTAFADEAETIITEVAITGFVKPSYGAVPITAADLSVAEDAPYTIEKMDWIGSEVNNPAVFGGGTWFAAIYLKAKEGYRFADLNAGYFDCCSLDGGGAVETSAGGPVNGSYVLYTYSCSAVITDIAITGFVAPEYGKKSITKSDMSVPEGAGYEITSLVWFHNGNTYNAEDSVSFEEGKWTARIGLAKKKDAGSFEDPTCTINGKTDDLDADYCKNDYDAYDVRTIEYEVKKPEQQEQAVAYDLWVGGVQVTSANAANVLGDNNVSYDAATNTLTVGSTAITAYSQVGNIEANIYSGNGLTINAKDGLNLSAADAHCVYVKGNLTINGTVTAQNELEMGSDSVIHANNGDVNISGKVTIPSGGSGIRANNITLGGGAEITSVYESLRASKLEVTGNVTVESKGTYAIYANSIRITGTVNAKNNPNNGSTAIVACDSVNIGGKVTIPSCAGGIRAQKDIILGAGAEIAGCGELLCSFEGSINVTGDVKAEVTYGEHNAIYAQKDITITGAVTAKNPDYYDRGVIAAYTGSVNIGGKVTIPSGGSGIRAKENITLGGGAEITAKGEALSAKAITVSGDAKLKSTDSCTITATGTVTMKDGTWILDSNTKVLSAGSFSIPNTYGVLEPEGGIIQTENNEATIVNKNGNLATHAVIKDFLLEVSFEMNGHGTAPSKQQIIPGSQATKPADPSETGWKFEGWYSDAACTNAFDFDYIIIENATIYAKWSEDVPVTYTVVSGASGAWTKDSGNAFEMIIKRSVKDEECFSHFKSVEIDGVALTSGTDYEAKAGSTVITLKAAALQALSDGTHNVTVKFDEAEVKTTLTIEAAASTGGTTEGGTTEGGTTEGGNTGEGGATEGGNTGEGSTTEGGNTSEGGSTANDPKHPKTGDNSNLMLWIALLCISAMAMAGCVLMGNKKENYGSK